MKTLELNNQEEMELTQALRMELSYEDQDENPTHKKVIRDILKRLEK